jgi:hypothetical protein
LKPKQEKINIMYRFLLRFFIALPFIACTCFHAAGNPPPWVYGDMPRKTNATYYFKVAHGKGFSLNDARNEALMKLVSELAQEQGVTVRGNSILENISEQHNGQEDFSSFYKSTYDFETAGFKVRFDIVDEYADGADYWMLFEVAYNPASVRFDKVEFTTDYGGKALLRSIIVPGWGQMYKGSMGKGIIILSAEVASIAGALVCENLRSSYYNKAVAEQRNASVQAQYQNRAISYRNIRNGFIVAASAIYVYNIVDVVSAKGGKRYKLAASPQGMSLSINF